MNPIETKPIIIHVDDDDSNRYAVKRILEKAQYTVLSAGDGKSGLDLINSTTPDLIILDIQLPDINGRDLCRKIKQNEKYAKIPILQMSANFTSSEDTVSGLESGADGYLVQPIDPPVLIATIRSLLRLRRAEQEAERSNLAKSQFLANMSHEIRTPLGAMMGFIDLLKHDDLTPQQQKDYLSIVERNSNQLLNLIDDILDLSKVESGRVDLEYLPVKLKEFFESLMVIWDVTAHKRNIGISLKYETEIPEVILIDPTRLRQILINIVGNAIKFTNEGQVELFVSYLPHHQLAIEIKDSGIGISPDQGTRLFQPFSQADASMNRVYGGTGLGLVLSRHLAQLLKGDVRLLDSAISKGSRFLVTVQAEGIESASKAPAKEKNYKPGSFGIRGLKTLLVEDSPDNQALINIFLSKEGIVPDIATNGRSGLEKALQEKYDLILMDIQMPLMDGYEATARLRRSGVDTPIIALTAHAMSEEKTKCLQAGFSDYLSKPVNKTRLYEMIRQHAGHARKPLDLQ